MATIASADWPLLLHAWFWAFLGLVFYAYVQRLALSRVALALPTRTLLKILFQARFYALFMPGGTNFLVKWYKLGRPLGRPGRVLASMIVFRLALNVALLAIVSLAVWFDASLPWQAARQAAPLVLAALLAGYLAMGHVPRLMHALARWAVRYVRLPRVVQQGIDRGRFLPDDAAPFGYGRLMLLLGLSVAAHLCETLQHVYIGRAVGLELSFLTYAWLRGVIVLCGTLPVSLAGLGLREASMAALLAAYGVPQEQSIAYSLLFFSGFIVVKGLVGGLTELWDVMHKTAPPLS